MLNNILSVFGFEEGRFPEAGDASRRRHARHDGSGARVTIGKNIYPLRDWDMSGASFLTTPEDYLDVGERVEMRFEFSLPQGSIDVTQEAVITRMAQRGVSAALFTAVSPAARRRFERVLDALYAQDFLRSQAA